MMSTTIFRFLFASLMLFQYAGVSLGMDPFPPTSRPDHGVRRTMVCHRQTLLRRFQEEIETLNAELAEANRYINARHGMIPTNIYQQWAERLRARLYLAYRDCLEIIHRAHVPGNYNRPWYSIGSEKRSAMHELTDAGYRWVDLTPRPPNRSAILQSEHFERLWQNIGNMNNEWTDLAYNRDHLQMNTRARKLYNDAMNELETRIDNEIDYSRNLVLGAVQAQPRADYHSGSTFQQLMEAFQKHGLDWDRVHAHISPPS